MRAIRYPSRTRALAMCYPSAMRLIFLTLASLLTLTACGPDPSETTTDGATDSITTATTATTGTSTGTTTATTATTDMPTTGTPGTTTTASTTAATTGASDTGSTTTSAGTGTGTSSDITTGESTDTGMAGLCDDDADCKLADDCCDCDGVPIDVDVAVCDLDCKQSKCSELGIKAAVCRFGVCTTPRLSCDANVACDSLPPPCEPGTLPETTPACWSGRCIPAKHCDVVGNCDECPDDRVCVQNVGFGPEPGATCEILPPGCDPAAPCV